MEDTLVQNQPSLRRPVRAIPQPETKKERIKVWMGACMTTVALSVDGLQALLTVVGVGVVLAPVLSVAAYFAFWIWFMILGVSFIGNPKKLFTMGATGVAEIVPLFDALPLFTAGVLTTVMMTMAEDKGGIIGKVAQGAQGKIT